MKIYSDHLTEHEVRLAFQRARLFNDADILIDGDITTWEPRNHLYGTEVFAQSMHGKIATSHVPARASGPRDGYPRAASWDDWGYVIAYLFRMDPAARIGRYDGFIDFGNKVRYRRPGSRLAFLEVLEG